MNDVNEMNEVLCMREKKKQINPQWVLQQLKME